MIPYPAAAAERDRFIVARRGPRAVHDPWRSQGLTIEDERTEDGVPARVGTVYLTGRECAWRCVMCDLWRSTTDEVTPAGAIPAQLLQARREYARTLPAVTRVKAYNASSFFDPHAVPDADYPAIARALAGLDQVIVESHPSLIGPRVDRFLGALDAASATAATPRLEVAMGLETAHPDALERLNKRMTVGMFSQAAAALVARGVSIRAFVLVYPPFVPLHEQDRWLRQSVATALGAGASVVSLIPTRSGNGAMDVLETTGDFHPPALADLERSHALALAIQGGSRVFADLWDLDRLAACADCAAARRERLHQINLTQTVSPSVTCTRCGAGLE